MPTTARVVQVDLSKEPPTKNEVFGFSDTDSRFISEHEHVNRLYDKLEAYIADLQLRVEALERKNGS